MARFSTIEKRSRIVTKITRVRIVGELRGSTKVRTAERNVPTTIAMPAANATMRSAISSMEGTYFSRSQEMYRERVGRAACIIRDIRRWGGECGCGTTKTQGQGMAPRLGGRLL